MLTNPQHPLNSKSMNLPHTDFEGFRAMSTDTLHAIPDDINGLKDALKPQQYISPLREQRLNEQHQLQQQRLELDMNNNIAGNLPIQSY